MVLLQILGAFMLGAFGFATFAVGFCTLLCAMMALIGWIDDAGKWLASVIALPFMMAATAVCFGLALLGRYLLTMDGEFSPLVLLAVIPGIVLIGILGEK